MPDSEYENLISRLQLNMQTSEPYYQQLKRKILMLIENGELQSGFGLPSERVLAEALNLSRTTVRRCYEDLRQSGQLGTHGRGGTQVKETPRVSPALGRLKGFTEEMGELGIAASARVEAYDIMHNRTIASVFQRPSTASFLRLIRIRLGDGVPMTREVAWYDLTLAPSLANWDTSGSAYSFLEQQCHIKLSWAEQSIEAVMSSDEESKVFGFEQSSPCLLLTRKSYTQQNQLMEYVEGTFRGDAYAYRVKLEV
jgi:GntR family transcriptional regulator